MLKPDFITMVEDAYAKPLIVSIQQLQKIYPQATFYVYDSGLSTENIKRIQEAGVNVQVIAWTMRLFTVRLIYTKRRLLKRGLELLQDSFLRLLHLESKNPHLDLIYQQQEFEIKIKNKLAIIKHHADTTESPFIFIDADALLLQNIDELLQGDFDIGFTIRGGNLDYRFNYCRLLYSGIVFMLGSPKQNRIFMQAWSDEAERTEEAFTEQTSIARLLHRKVPTIYEYMDKVHIVDFEQEKIRVKMLSARIYNNTAVGNFVQSDNTDTIKVLHFKNRSFNKPVFEKVLQKIN